MDHPMDPSPRDPEAKEYIKLPKKKRKPLSCRFGNHKQLVDIMPGCHVGQDYGTKYYVYECEGCGQGLKVDMDTGKTHKIDEFEIRVLKEKYDNYKKKEE